MRVCQFRHFGTHVNVQRERLDRQQFLVLQTLPLVSNSALRTEDYSARSAFTGSIAAALCAGMTLAINAEMASATIDTPRTSGSHPLT